MRFTTVFGIFNLAMAQHCLHKYVADDHETNRNLLYGCGGGRCWSFCGVSWVWLVVFLLFYCQVLSYYVLLVVISAIQIVMEPRERDNAIGILIAQIMLTTAYRDVANSQNYKL